MLHLFGSSAKLNFLNDATATITPLVRYASWAKKEHHATKRVDAALVATLLEDPRIVAENYVFFVSMENACTIERECRKITRLADEEDNSMWWSQPTANDHEANHCDGGRG